MASVRFQLEKLGEDKHVESVLIHCLDEGSTPSISTAATPIVDNPVILLDGRIFLWTEISLILRFIYQNPQDPIR
jgi:hypothetical protein